MTGATLARRLWEDVIPRGDVAQCDELFAVDYVEHALAPFGTDEPGRVEGPAHMRRVVGSLKEQFSDLTAVVEAVVEDGDTVAIRVQAEGTHDGAFNGVVPPTGKRFSTLQSHWYRVDAGKLVEHWATRDDLTMALQLGLVPRPGRP